MNLNQTKSNINTKYNLFYGIWVMDFTSTESEFEWISEKIQKKLKFQKNIHTKPELNLE